MRWPTETPCGFATEAGSSLSASCLYPPLAEGRSRGVAVISTDSPPQSLKGALGPESNRLPAMQVLCSPACRGCGERPIYASFGSWLCVSPSTPPSAKSELGDRAGELHPKPASKDARGVRRRRTRPGAPDPLLSCCAALSALAQSLKDARPSSRAAADAPPCGRSRSRRDLRLAHIVVSLPPRSLGSAFKLEAPTFDGLVRGEPAWTPGETAPSMPDTAGEALCRSEVISYAPQQLT